MSQITGINKYDGFDGHLPQEYSESRPTLPGLYDNTLSARLPTDI